MSVIDWFENTYLRFSRPHSAETPNLLENSVELTDTDIWAQVDRICNGLEFASSARITRFLRFITEETVSGRGDRLKAFTIGIAVFERPESFDAQTDPIVRIEAGRLRRMLEHYYLTQGKADPVVITVPKGAYTPCFAWRDAKGEPEAPSVRPSLDKSPPRVAARRWGGVLIAGVLLVAACVTWAARSLTQRGEDVATPTVLVLPFVASGKGDLSEGLAAGISDALIDQLATFNGLRVLGRETSRWAQSNLDLTRIRSEMGVRYLVEGNVRQVDDMVSIVARLIDAKTGSVIWLSRSDSEQATDVGRLQVEVGKELATKIGQPYGVIYRNDSGQLGGRVPLNWTGYRCTLQYYNYRIALSRESHAAARNCLEQLVSTVPDFATGWGMLSMLYLDEVRGGYPSGPGRTGLQGALEAGRRAVEADPDDVRALQALSLALYFASQPDDGRAMGEKALSINPNDPELLSELGVRIAQAGDPARGRELLTKALAVNPGNAGYYMGNLALVSFLEGQIEQAVKEIEASNLSRYSGYYIVAAMVYADAGRLDEARRAGKVVMNTRPGFVSQFDAEMRKRNLSRAAVERMRKALLLAGVPIATPATESMLER
ncbi:hypothetical protein WDZ92_24700 [Nostoc sp. NIES-2111]